MRNAFHRSMPIMLVCALLLAVTSTPAQIRMGAMGDSYTDEYSRIDPNGVTAGLYNWVEVMVFAGRADFGPIENFPNGDPRHGTGNGSHRHNFALGGATADSLLGSGPPLYTNSQCGSPVGAFVWGGFREAARTNQFDYGFVFIGGNNFIREAVTVVNNVPVGPGILSVAPPNPQSIAKVNEIFSDFEEGYNIATGGSGNDVKMLIGTLPDLGTFDVILWDAANLSAAHRANLRAHVQIYNDALRAFAANKGAVIVEWWDLWENLRSQGTVDVGGVPIDILGVPTDNSDRSQLTYFMINDGLHPSPVGHGLMANVIIDALRNGYGETSIAPLTDEEILSIAGIPTPTVIPTATPAPTATATAVPTTTAMPSPTATTSPTPTATATPPATATPTATPSPTPTSTATPSPTVTPVPTGVTMLTGYANTDLGPRGGILGMVAFAPTATTVELVSRGVVLRTFRSTSPGIFTLGEAFSPSVGQFTGEHLLEVRGDHAPNLWPYLTVVP